MSPGVKAGVKRVEMCPFYKKNECYELKFHNYTLNHVGKLTNIQLIQTDANFQVSVV